MSRDTLATVVGIRRILLKTLLVFALLAAGLAVTPKLYRMAKVYRYNSLAEERLQDRQYPQALFYAQSVLRLSPANDRAVGLIARVSVETNQPSALLWLGRWAERNPKDPVRLLLLGKMALVQRQPAVTETCLNLLKKLPKTDPAQMLELESSFLVSTGKEKEARTLLSAAVSTPDPHPDLLYNYGTLLLTQPELSHQQEGILTLQKLSTKPDWRPRALGNLIRYGLDKNNKDLATRTAGQLALNQNLPLSQYLLLNEVSLRWEEKLLDSFMVEIISRLEAHTFQIPVVVHWLLQKGKEEEADRLLAHYKTTGLAPEIVYPLLASRMEARGDWDEILDELQDPEWQVMGPLRDMYLMQACRKLNKPENVALKKSLGRQLALSIRRHPQELLTMDRLAREWKWTTQRILIWDAFAKTSHFPVSFLQTELILAQKQGDTILLYGLSRILSNQIPQSAALKNNIITYALLLNQDLPGQLKLARDQSLAEPRNPAYRTTYALALLKNKQEEEALAQFAVFSESELLIPEVAAYYAMALLANGAKAKAVPYMALAQKAFLLPEEQAFLK